MKNSNSDTISSITTTNHNNNNCATASTATASATVPATAAHNNAITNPNNNLDDITEAISIDVRSEIGELEGVILHTPGPEVENMTPGNAGNALYGDIINMAVAQREHAQLEGVLRKFTRVYQIRELLEKILHNEEAKRRLVEHICALEDIDAGEELLSRTPGELSRVLIEGLEMNKNTLTKFLNKDRYLLAPLHNFFFTRDAAVSIRNDVLICQMANRVRERESIIFKAIFDSDSIFNTRTHTPTATRIAKHHDNYPPVTIEGGDVLIARDDVLVIGNGARTSTTGIDYLLERIRLQNGMKRHIIVQELPHKPDSFIHLDMVFTLLDVDTCMVFEPLLRNAKYKTVHIEVDNGKVNYIRYADDGLLQALGDTGIHLKPVYCGGTKDQWIQEREQWHSGANFFAIGPGRIIGYERNSYTMQELNKEGYEIIPARDLLENRVNGNQYKKFVIALEGSELPRGGGGARCMTMPIRRSRVI